jgi:hypothetical protein
MEYDQIDRRRRVVVIAIVVGCILGFILIGICAGLGLGQIP